MNAEKYTQKTLDAVKTAQSMAQENGNQYLTPEHLLYALVDADGGLIGTLLGRMGVDCNAVLSELDTAIDQLPKVSGACKTYAYYDAVTDKTSPAYAVLNSGTYRGVTYKTTTDETTGIRMVGEYYCAALGTFYGTTKGTKYKVTLDTGKTFKIILCDTKSNRHTDKKHQYAKKNKDVVEFYVDRTKIPAGVNGNYNRLEPFHGKIQSIELLTEWDRAES
mgnify:FL=1